MASRFNSKTNPLKSRHFFKDHFKIFFQSFFPNNYRRLSVLSFKYIINHFFFVFFASLLLFFIISIPFFVSVPSSLGSFASHFDFFNVSVNASMNSPFIVSDDPLVLVDLNKSLSNDSDEFVLINNSGFFVSAPLLDYSVFWRDVSNVKAAASKYGFLFKFLFYLLLPSFFLFVFLLLLFESLLVIFSFFLVSLLIIRISGFEISSGQLLKIIILSWSLALFFQLLFFPFFGFLILLFVFLFFVLFFSVVVWLSGTSFFQKKSF